MVSRQSVSPGYARIACGLSLISLLCGCFNASTAVTVKKDGSGTVTETVLITETVAAWTGTNSAEANLYSHKLRCRDRAINMGRGVTLGTVEEVRTNGMTGFKAVYAFKDVRHLAVDQQPDLSILGNLVQGKTTGSLPVTFGLDMSSSPTLVVNFPKPRTPANSLAQTLVPPMPKGIVADERAVIRTLFKNFRIQLSITAQGGVVSPKASHIASGGKDTAFLLDLDIAKTLEDDRQLDKLLALGQINDMDTARARLSGAAGIKIEPAERIEIVFR